jgi:Mce-associated membrane protein
MTVRDIRNGRPVARRRVVRQIRQMAPSPDEVVADDGLPPDDEGLPHEDEVGSPDEETESSGGESSSTLRAPERARRLRRRTTRGRPRRSVILALLLLAAVVATLAVTGQRWYQQQRLDAARQDALAAARQTTVDFVSISAATVDRDLQRISAGATGAFKDEFTRGLTQVRTAVVENKVSSTGTVLRAALVSGDRDSAVVLVAIDASVKNTGAPDGRISHYRIQVDLAVDPSSGRWLVSRLQFVG